MTKIITGLLIAVGASLALAGVASADPVTDLAQANGISNPNLILTGQVLHVEGQPDYVVRAGDTLTLITRQLGTSPVPAVNVSAVAPEGGTALAGPDVGVPLADTPPPLPPAPKTHLVNWNSVAACESGGNWAINTGNGYEGGVQFLNSTWRSVKAPDDPPHAYQASPEAQMAAADRLLSRSGIGQWPVCGRRA